MSGSRSSPVLWCLAAAALFGASTPASKALLPGLGPLALAGLLYLGAAAAVLPFAFRGGSPRLRTRPRNLLALLLAAGCSPETGAPGTAGGGARVPAVLADLVLARDSDEITPVRFPHARHLDPGFAGRALDCADCHHTLEDLPGSIPAACGTCHPHEAEEGKPPDI